MTPTHTAHHRHVCCLMAALCAWMLAIPELRADPGSSNSQTSDTSSNTSAASQSNSNTTDPGVTTGDFIKQTSSQIGVTSLQAFAVVLGVALVTVTFGGTTVGITWTVSGSRPELSKLQYYLREHQPAVQQALAMGGGEVIDDLADMFDLPAAHRARFGLVMRRAQSALIPMISGQITPQTAISFAEASLVIMLADPLLGPEIFARGVTALQITTALPDAYYDPEP